MKQQQITISHIWALNALILFFYTSSIFGQNGVGINTLTPKSTLDIVSTSVNSTLSEGMQAPRLTLAQLTLKGNATYGAAQTGAIIYITDIAGGGNSGQRINISTPGYYYFDGTIWQKLNKTTTIISQGDIVQSFRPADFAGWYLMDGRAVSTLPTNARTAAIALGFTTSLPDARNRVLKNKSTTESLATTGGTASWVISQANLPNITLTGTATGTLASAGAHGHVTSGTLAAGGAHTHTVSGTLAAGGAHTHAVSGNLNSAGAHSHSLTSVWVMPGTAKDVDRGNRAGSAWSYIAKSTYTTSSAGNHNHSLSSTLVAGGGHTHSVTGNLATSNEHAHGITGSLAAGDAHTHTITGSLASTGAHTHSVSGTASLPLNGNSTAINNRSAYLVVNTFIYLGI